MTEFTPPPLPGEPGGQGGTPGPTVEERQYAMFIHLSALLATVTGVGILAPLVLWMIKKDRSPYIDYHGKQAVNFNLSVIIYGIVSAVLIIIGVGLLMLLALVVGWFVLVIVAGIKANDGEYYRYPLTLPLIS